jgi:hypothetical protein
MTYFSYRIKRSSPLALFARREGGDRGDTLVFGFLELGLDGNHHEAGQPTEVNGFFALGLMKSDNWAIIRIYEP